MTPTRVAILLFVSIAALGPLYTAPGYSPLANVISELAAQHTRNNFVMSAAFVILGGAIVWDGIAAFRKPHIPFMLFGVFFAAAGFLGHKPIAPGAPYSAWMHEAHGALATGSGIALTVGFIWRLVIAKTNTCRFSAGSLALLCVCLPLLMLKLPAYQGVIQRFMYLAVFTWLWIFYPGKAKESPRGRLID